MSRKTWGTDIHTYVITIIVRKYYTTVHIIINTALLTTTDTSCNLVQQILGLILVTQGLCFSDVWIWALFYVQMTWPWNYKLLCLQGLGFFWSSIRVWINFWQRFDGWALHWLTEWFNRVQTTQSLEVGWKQWYQKIVCSLSDTPSCHTDCKEAICPL